MPRIARKDTIGSYIHMITQGIKKEFIFKKEEYKKEYIKLVKDKFDEAKDLQLLCYCVMDNHTHILVHTDHISELSKVMAKINTSYGLFYNRLENRVGYVFRNRYYSQPIKDEKHLYNTIVYIHRNPVKAKMVNCMEDYKYSSYNDMKNGNLDEKCIKLLFKEKEYINRFNNIHKNFDEKDILEIEENILEIKEEFVSEKEVNKFVEEFCENHQVSIEKLKKNNELLDLAIKKIKNKYYIMDKQIIKILGIGKNRITNLKKMKN